MVNYLVIIFYKWKNKKEKLIKIYKQQEKQHYQN